MTMLERAARAAYGAYGFTSPWTEDFGYGVAQPDTKEAFRNVTRAVLMAVREPGMDATLAGADKVNENMRGSVKADYCAAADAFTAMIDAILSEDPS